MNNKRKPLNEIQKERMDKEKEKMKRKEERKQKEANKQVWATLS